MKKLFSFLIVLLLHCNYVAAANITVKDCAVGGVPAGWHSSHHYLPQKFNKTALRDVEWKQWNGMIPLDKYPSTGVYGFQNIGVGRISADESLAMIGVLTRRSQEAGNLYQAIFEKDFLYIATISVFASNNINTSYELLATDMQTPRGIHIGSTLEEMLAKYGEPDEVKKGDNGLPMYYYYTSETALKKKTNKNYQGAGMIFYVTENTIYAISVFNTFGY